MASALALLILSTSPVAEIGLRVSSLTGKTTVVMADPDARVPAVRWPTANSVEAINVALKYTGYSVVGNLDLAVLSPSWPLWKIDPRLPLPGMVDAKKNPVHAFDGLISSTRPKTIRVGSLSEVKWRRPLRIHWFYRNLGVNIYGDKVTPEELLPRIAASIGAKFTRGEKSDAFELDVVAFRSRMTQGLRRPLPRESTDRQSDYELMRLCMPELTDQHLITALDKNPNRGIRFSLGQLPKAQKAVKRAYLWETNYRNSERNPVLHTFPFDSAKFLWGFANMEAAIKLARPEIEMSRTPDLEQARSAPLPP